MKYSDVFDTALSLYREIQTGKSAYIPIGGISAWDAALAQALKIHEEEKSRNAEERADSTVPFSLFADLLRAFIQSMHWDSINPCSDEHNKKWIVIKGVGMGGVERTWSTGKHDSFEEAYQDIIDNFNETI